MKIIIKQTGITFQWCTPGAVTSVQNKIQHAKPNPEGECSGLRWQTKDWKESPTFSVNESSSSSRSLNLSEYRSNICASGSSVSSCILEAVWWTSWSVGGEKKRKEKKGRICYGWWSRRGSISMCSNVICSCFCRKASISLNSFTESVSKIKQKKEIKKKKEKIHEFP